MALFECGSVRRDVRPALGLAITPPGLPRLAHRASRGSAAVSFASPAMAATPLVRACPIRIISVHLLDAAGRAAAGAVHRSRGASSCSSGSAARISATSSCSRTSCATTCSPPARECCPVPRLTRSSPWEMPGWRCSSKRCRATSSAQQAGSWPCLTARSSEKNPLAANSLLTEPRARSRLHPGSGATTVAPGERGSHDHGLEQETSAPLMPYPPDCRGGSA
jgi:hypothetical protein